MAKKLGNLEKGIHWYFRNGHLSRNLGSLEDVEDGCQKLVATFYLKKKAQAFGGKAETISAPIPGLFVFENDIDAYLFPYTEN